MTGAEFRYRRTALGLSLGQVGRSARVSKVQVLRFERGAVRKPRWPAHMVFSLMGRMLDDLQPPEKPGPRAPAGG